MADQTRTALATGSAPVQPYTMTFDQAAHQDWDWINNFPQNFWYAKASDGQQGVQHILDKAIANLQEFNTGGNKPYFYSICEMGFLQRYIEQNPSQAAAIQNAGNNFQVIGGGVTSPDCLVCSGEGFIRNYLVGHVWLSRALPGVPPRPQCWIPDDFGQGPELPVLLQALGFAGVGFGRVPGSESTNPQSELLSKGLDFVWRASDGSQAIGHWIVNSYSFGEKLEKLGPQAINLFTEAYQPDGAQPVQYSAAATPSMYIAVEDDFSMPVSGLLDDVAAWNNNQVSGGGAQASNVQVTAGTFDGFIAAIKPLQGSLAVFPYNGTPYWTGYYASRPELKILHYAAMRALVAAEIFGLLTQPGNAQFNNMLPHTFWSDLAETWTDFVPSTHHDYVCGTALDSVYATEQLPLLQAVAARACGLRAAALNALAGMTPSLGPWPNATQQLLAANSLGFATSGLAEISNVALPGVQSVCFDGNNYTPVQRSADGGMLLIATVPSLGYVSGTLSTAQPTAQAPSLTIAPASTGSNSYILRNKLLTATISEAANWGIASLVDNISGHNIIAGNSIGNDLAFYQDSGGLYRFGNEDFGTFQADGNVVISTSGPGLGAIVLETGPLRVRLRTTVLVTVDSETRYYTREYALVAGEPLLRITTTGAAPSGYSVMAQFPFASPVASIAHGTACHWTAVQPLTGFWGPPTFQATHDFLLPQDDNGNTLAAIYHGAIPAWAFDSSGALIGCLLRNTPADAEGAHGTDTAAHTQHYAIRVPANLGGAGSGQPLQEALAYTTPLQAVEIPPGDRPYNPSGMITAATGSLAAVTSPAIVTVAKPGSFDPTSLILRFYQPTNASENVQVTLGNGTRPASVTAVTAAEGTWSGPAMPLQSTPSGFSLTMSAAVATVQVGGLGLAQARARQT